ncbi:glycosyl transferase, group 1 (plasmid) [Azospirillum sp. B510]|uniref:glycosyltransferase n=1 Tax=Azospirillum sp. (strain B510) TaxID=137722 RepID=UPI0001C4CF40|nr:glycosyltransferase [Azospirillum sp. B510]BAI76689.1 glycosyl transferase, group 1 [Azospirillum sp. B510]
MKICFILSSYISHLRAGIDYIYSLCSAGIDIVKTIEDADIVIIHDEPYRMVNYFRANPILKDKYVIGYCVWEADRLNPNQYRWLGLLDEIWTCSVFCRDIMRAVNKPVHVVPHIVKPAKTDPEADARLRERLGLAEERFVFYTMGYEWERKNIDAALKAFTRAFPDGSTTFVVKTTAPLQSALLHSPGVLNVVGHITDEEIAALHRIGHCYVSAHCSEGWGLCLSEAMANGNLVVATGYSGNMDFMNSGNSLLVDYTIEPIRQPATRTFMGFDHTLTYASWAYVDECHLSIQLRRAYDEWSELQPLRDRARAVIDQFSSAVVGEVMLQRLKEVMERNVLEKIDVDYINAE